MLNRSRKSCVAAGVVVAITVLFSASGCPRDQQQINEHQRALQTEQD